MKKMMSLSMLAVGMCLAAFAVADFSMVSWEQASQEVKVIDMGECTDQILNAVMKGDHPEIAIRFLAGTRLPLSFFFKGDLIHLVDSEGVWGQIEIQQTFYARYGQEGLILSDDLVEWKPVFEFITGQASMALRVDSDQPSIVLGIEANRRI